MVCFTTLEILRKNLGMLFHVNEISCPLSALRFAVSISSDGAGSAKEAHDFFQTK